MLHVKNTNKRNFYCWRKYENQFHFLVYFTWENFALGGITELRLLLCNDKVKKFTLIVVLTAWTMFYDLLILLLIKIIIALLIWDINWRYFWLIEVRNLCEFIYFSRNEHKFWVLNIKCLTNRLTNLNYLEFN